LVGMRKSQRSQFSAKRATVEERDRMLHRHSEPQSLESSGAALPLILGPDRLPYLIFGRKPSFVLSKTRPIFEKSLARRLKQRKTQIATSLQIIVVRVPHSSRHVPAEERKAICLDDIALDAELLRMTDAYTDVPFPATKVEAARLVFLVSRPRPADQRTPRLDGIAANGAPPQHPRHCPA
jgi:hypothetical protein